MVNECADKHVHSQVICKKKCLGFFLQNSSELCALAHQIQTYLKQHLCISASGADMPEAVYLHLKGSVDETLVT